MEEQDLGYTRLKSCLQLNHVPVHKTHSAKGRKLKTTSKTQTLTRIVPKPGKRVLDLTSDAGFVFGV
jgi:hypothetical protein